MPENDLYPDNETEDAKLDAEILSILEDYAALDTQSSIINDKRAKLRKKADDRGIPSLALQESVRKLKKFSKTERLEHERAVRRVLKAAEGKQGDLWPEEIAKAEKSRSRKAEKAAKAAAAAGKETPEQQQRRLAADSNPRSDPKSGGARRKSRKPVPEAVAERAEDTAERNAELAEVQAQSAGAEPGTMKPWPGDEQAAQNAAEQAEGDAILTSHIDTMKNGLTGKTGLGSVADEKPMSQSAQVAAINEKLGLDK